MQQPPSPMHPPGQPQPQGQPYGPGPAYPPPPKSSGAGKILLILAVVGVCGVFVLGILAAIAIPAFTKYMRRSKTSEARVMLARMYDRASAYYGEHGRCPGDGRNEAGVTPPLAVNCNDGQGGRCSVGSGGPGAYGAELWTENETWSALGFEQSGSHYFRYNFRWEQTDDTCMFTAMAFGDLDDDGIYSTFERSGAADVNGVSSAAGLYIDLEVE